MTVKLFSVFDTIKMEMSPPFQAKNEGQAWREWDILIANDKYAIDHTDEFHLYELADFDTDNGEIFTAGPRLCQRNLNNATFEHKGEELNV